MEVYVLIFILSVVQSLFGVGLLLFGTPLMLLLGYEYTEALMYLLPASAALSWSQVSDHRGEKLNGGYRKNFFLLTLPLLILGLLISTEMDIKKEIKIFVTLMLFVSFILRTSAPLRERLQVFMKTHLKLALGLMGIVHGLSNMGGSILTPLVSSLYKDKNKVLAAVSFDYAFMATLQMVVIWGVKGEVFQSRFLWGALISLSVRYLLGKRIFAFTSDLLYQRLLNGFILANAILLIINFR